MNPDEIRKLFDVKGSSDDSEADDLIASAESGSDSNFDKISFEQSVKMLRDDLKMKKDDLGEPKTLEIKNQATKEIKDQPVLPKEACLKVAKNKEEPIVDSSIDMDNFDSLPSGNIAQKHDKEHEEKLEIKVFPILESGIDPCKPNDGGDYFDYMKKDKVEEIKNTEKTLEIFPQQEFDMAKREMGLMEDTQVKKSVEDMVSSIVKEENIENQIDDQVPVSDSQEKSKKEDTTPSIAIPTTLTSQKYDWFFKSPSPRFDIFYSEKKKIVERMLPDGEIPFEEWSEELKDVKVDIRSVVYDGRAIVDKMKEVQHWGWRIQDMQLRVNSQFYIWRRFLDLIQGFLAIVAYEKPAEKFRGVIYQHMGDMEDYFTRLEAIKENLIEVKGNLTSAYNSLSRQLTIASPVKDIPNAYGVYPSQAQVQTSSENMENQQSEQNITKKQFRSGKMDWD